MTFEEFDEYSKGLIEKCLKMRDTKGKEYAGSKDRFDNFNRLADKCKVSRLVVATIYLQKHVDALNSYLENGKEFSNEGIEGRIVDIITYYLLIAGMIYEDKKKSIPISHPDKSTSYIKTHPAILPGSEL